MTAWIVLGEKSFSATAAGVRDARAFTAATLPSPDPSETAVLLVSELVTNSVRHSDSRFGGVVTVILYDTGGALRCEVIDAGGPTVPVCRDACGTPREHGYGVVLVRELADRSGHRVDAAGRLHAWFEIDRNRGG